MAISERIKFGNSYESTRGIEIGSSHRKGILKKNKVTNHLVFTDNPNTGKMTEARLILNIGQRKVI
jgi:hypothetical protein